MREEIATLKSGQDLLTYRADQTDKVIAKLENTLERLTKGGYIFLGIFIADSIGAGEFLKVFLKSII